MYFSRDVQSEVDRSSQVPARAGGRGLGRPHDGGNADDRSRVNASPKAAQRPYRRRASACYRQHVGFPLVLELAVERLRPNPLLLADFYPGDVLAALVRVDERDWEGRNDLREALADLFSQVMAQTSDDANAFRESLQLPLDRRAN